MGNGGNERCLHSLDASDLGDVVEDSDNADHVLVLASDHGGLHLVDALSVLFLRLEVRKVDLFLNLAAFFERFCYQRSRRLRV